MSDLLEMLTQTLGGNALGQISRQIGAADEQSTAKAISAALPIIVGAMNRNTDQRGGADALFNALNKDHDGSILENLTGFLGGAQSGPGDAILGHVLGGKRQSVETGLSRMSGLDLGSIAKLLPILAPIVMGLLGRTQRQKGFDANGLSEFLTGERQRAASRNPAAVDILGNLLDTNNDGQVVDDVVKLGTSLLGGLFGPKK
jgi:hypothetical protein